MAVQAIQGGESFETGGFAALWIPLYLQIYWSM
jgi:hypothetical protein